MSEPLLNVMKVMLLAGLYLFFVRVLWSVFSELRDPRTVARKRAKAAGSSTSATRATTRRAASAAPQAPSQPGYAPATEPAHGGVAVAAARGQLVIIEPAQLAGTGYTLGREITLGRANTNGIVLNDTYVSTVHARIFHTNGTYFIEDLASRNGSSLNEQALVATTALVPGDRVQLGGVTMEFQ